MSKDYGYGGTYHDKEYPPVASWWRTCNFYCDHRVLSLCGWTKSERSATIKRGGWIWI